ncbi:hypothetical protein FIBSPDRAFT_905062 [Athelia psychrophila]|uniref:Wax synthase domain-containing protein n=1 Tax=Athelia psychrophila TaxID=1759441 RepID=A0A167TXT7_9AGAM|nr:hypothetical protein FIBSPDRAFT_905062 [Fibularhizoctonia sp. CBS 109695]
MASKPALPTVQFLVLPPLFLALVMAVRPSLPFRILAFALLSLVSYYGIVAYSTGDVSIDYLQGTTFGIAIANAIHFLLLSDPMVDFRHDSDTASPTEKGILGRMYWCFGLQNAMRGIGWNYRLPHTPDSPTDERWPFVARQLKTQTYIQWNPSFGAGDKIR